MRECASADGEWILSDVADSNQIGSFHRIREKMVRLSKAIHTTTATPVAAVRNELIEEYDRRTLAAEQEASMLRERATHAERRLTGCEERLRDCEEKLQRLETQWVVERREIHLTGPELGRGGWATVSIATFRGVNVAAKCIHNQIVSP